MTPRARAALVALLVSGALVALHARPVTVPGARVQRTAEPGDAAIAIGLLIILASAALALAIYAALRFRPVRHRPVAEQRQRQTPWRAAALALLGLITLTIVLGHVVARIGRGPTTGIGGPGDTGTVEQGDHDPRPAPGEGSGGELPFDLWTVFIVGALLLLLLTSLLITRTAHRDDAGEAEDDTAGGHQTQQGLPSLEHAATQALVAVEHPTAEPRAAIIACYAAMERALDSVPGARPLPADTASDVLVRAIDSGQLGTASGTRLVSLFAEARYSAHPMTDADRDDAAHALRSILDDVRRSAWTGS